ncbi:hypothetical protein B0H66DRAFT_597410 [Apodospora peruviana]|uniref:Uncharacterized protein n=1 Tax=Apodospora peruviana TaxID=516989 RepID=A0AAE0IRR7_9PEZI|nr:hypothetical protein B0H66DRAFT_597410 [Apodospora peruviana]
MTTKEAYVFPWPTATEIFRLDDANTTNAGRFVRTPRNPHLEPIVESTDTESDLGDHVAVGAKAAPNPGAPSGFTRKEEEAQPGEEWVARADQAARRALIKEIISDKSHRSMATALLKVFVMMRESLTMREKSVHIALSPFEAKPAKGSWEEPWEAPSTRCWNRKTPALPGWKEAIDKTNRRVGRAIDDVVRRRAVVGAGGSDGHSRSGELLEGVVDAMIASMWLLYSA